MCPLHGNITRIIILDERYGWATLFMGNSNYSTYTGKEEVNAFDILVTIKVRVKMKDTECMKFLDIQRFERTKN